jgi:hypothetical protein
MTQNQIFAVAMLGALPSGYICVSEVCNAHSPTWARVGAIYADGRCLFMFNMADVCRT